MNTYFDESFNSMRVSIFLGLLIWWSFGFLDAIVAPETKNFLWLVRYVLVSPVIVLSFFLLYLNSCRKYMEIIIPLIIGFVELSVVLMICHYPDPVKSHYYAGMIAVYMYGFACVKMRFIWTLWLAVITVACFEAAVLLDGSMASRIIFLNSFFLIGAKVCGLVVCYSVELYIRKSFLLRRELEIERANVISVNNSLEQRVAERTAQLKFINNELFDTISEQKKTEQSLLESRKRINSLTQELVNAQEAERRRIAMDLHDNVAQDLASLVIGLNFFSYKETGLSDEFRQKFTRYSEILKKGIKAIREASYDLQPPDLRNTGLSEELYRLCNEFSLKQCIDIDFSSAGMDDVRLDYDVSINLYRLVQEALNNIRKHACATGVNVKIVATGQRVIVRIDDNGAGFDFQAALSEAAENKRMGLSNMEARVSLLNGSFKIKTAHGEGTKICAEIPVSCCAT
ncbi:MAG: sensor histidine kinase [Desulfobacteraceae bacterium]|nr:sensor histidine kinase [Desulfobacteraceae bacterium]